MTFEHEEIDGKYTDISQFLRAEKDSFVLKSDKILITVNGRHRLSALQVFGIPETRNRNQSIHESFWNHMRIFEYNMESRSGPWLAIQVFSMTDKSRKYGSIFQRELRQRK